jgi:hypothetical protein
MKNSGQYAILSQIERLCLETKDKHFITISILVTIVNEKQT